MPWDNRGYYYRKKRIGLRVVSEYVGRGEFASICANGDAYARHAREMERADVKAEQAKTDALDESMAAMDALVSSIMKQELQAAGYHQHARGQWRKRRDNQSN